MITIRMSESIGRDLRNLKLRMLSTILFATRSAPTPNNSALMAGIEIDCAPFFSACSRTFFITSRSRRSHTLGLLSDFVGPTAWIICLHFSEPPAGVAAI